MLLTAATAESVLGTVDRFLSVLAPVNTLVDAAVEKLVPQVSAEACHGSAYLCSSTCISSYCCWCNAGQCWVGDLEKVVHSQDPTCPYYDLRTCYQCTCVEPVDQC